MRSFFVHLRDATEREVTEFLQRTFPFQQGPPWIYEVDGDPCLYIAFYRDRQMEFESEELVALSKALGKAPTTSIMADVSGRHAGDDHVRYFIAKILGQYAGVAQDDYSGHCWTAAEVLSDNKVEGRRFCNFTRASA